MILASIGGFASPIGAIVLGAVIDVFGRRTALMLSIIPHFIGWLLIFSNINISVTLLGRFVTGLTAGTLFYPAQVYTAECITINNLRLRNNFSTWAPISNSTGIFLTFFFSCFVSYLTISTIAVILSVVVFLLIFIFIPESPTWLYLKGRIRDAELSEKKLGIFQPILRNSKIVTTNDDDTLPLISEKFKFRWSNYESILTKIKRQDIRRPIIRMAILKILVICSGGYVILPYMVDIIGTNGVTESTVDESYLFSVISGILIFVARLSTSIVLPILGFKKYMISSCILSAIGMFLIGYTTNSKNTFEFDWYLLHVIAVWMTSFLFNFGTITLPVAITTDLFPVDGKGFASIPVLISLLVRSFFVKMHPYFCLYYGNLTYTAYAIAGIVCAIFVHFYMPEVVGKTFKQINEYYV